MTEKLKCPECGSNYINLLDIVNLLDINGFNPDINICGNCDELWSVVTIDESSIPKLTEHRLPKCEIVWSETPSPNVIYNRWYEVGSLTNKENEEI